MFNFLDKAKSFGAKQMLKRQMQGVPEEQQQAIIDAIERNPAFFEGIAAEVKKRTDNGMGQMEAMMEVMKKNQEELQKMFGQTN